MVNCMKHGLTTKDKHIGWKKKNKKTKKTGQKEKTKNKMQRDL